MIRKSSEFFFSSTGVSGCSSSVELVLAGFPFLVELELELLARLPSRTPSATARWSSDLEHHAARARIEIELAEHFALPATTR